MKDNGISRLDPEIGKVERFSVPTNFPRFSWPDGVAYDSKRGLVSVVTFGGEGYLYRMNAASGTWVDYRSLNNVDLHAIVYDATSDRYVAWGNRGRLLFISGGGDLLFTHEVATKMKGLSRIYDPGNEPPPQLRLVARGNKVALIYAPNGYVKRIWYYDVKTDRMLLTFKSPST